MATLDVFLASPSGTHKRTPTNVASNSSAAMTFPGSPLAKAQGAQLSTTSSENVKSRGSLNDPIPKHCGTLFLVPHCCVWVLEPSGESTAQAVPLHYNCVRTLCSYPAVMFNTPPSKLGNDFPLKSELVSKLLSLRKQTAKHFVPLPRRRLFSPLAILSKVAAVQQFLYTSQRQNKK